MTNLGDVSKLFKIFDHGIIKYPKVRTKVDNHTVCLHLAGEKSKFSGSIQVTDGGQFPNGEWYGRIKRNGDFVASRSCPSYVDDFLKDLAEDPLKIAHRHGQRIGECLFCGLLLTSEFSVLAGYGPVCAKNFGFPWGMGE
jgi:hypothetical protein